MTEVQLLIRVGTTGNVKDSLLHLTSRRVVNHEYDLRVPGGELNCPYEQLQIEAVPSHPAVPNHLLECSRLRLGISGEAKRAVPDMDFERIPDDTVVATRHPYPPVRHLIRVAGELQT